jgi:hypothetical protein
MSLPQALELLADGSRRGPAHRRRRAVSGLVLGRGLSALSRLEAEITQIQCTRKRVPTPWGCFSVLWMRARHYTVVCTLQAAASLPRLHLAPAARCFCLESVL